MTTLRNIAVFAIAAGLCLAQTPAKLRFEVASIRPNTTPPYKYLVDDQRMDMAAMPLRSLVFLAFAVPSYQLDIPAWTATERFDIQATLPQGATKAQVPQMLQTLLADRFGFVFHHEAKEQPVYALIQAKDGAKLADAAADNRDETFLTGRSVMAKFVPPEGDGFWSISVKDGHRTFDAQRITMPELANILMQFFDDPVIDSTGLKGYWQLRFDVPQPHGRGPRPVAPSGPAGIAQDPEGVSIESSLRKLGLELDHRKAPVDHLVVDHIEKQPTEN